MKWLTSVVIGAALLGSSFAADLYAEDKFNTPRFERMTPKKETIFSNDLLPMMVKYDDLLQRNLITRRTYLKGTKTLSDGASGEISRYVTLSINCFGEERIMFYYDFFSKKSFERESFFGNFKRLPSDVRPDYSKMICSSALI